jgi:hypothetical protein
MMLDSKTNTTRMHVNKRMRMPCICSFMRPSDICTGGRTSVRRAATPIQHIYYVVYCSFQMNNKVLFCACLAGLTLGL